MPSLFHTILPAVCLLICASMVLSVQDAEAAPPLPEWAERLFPYTGVPDRLQHRLRRIGGSALEANGKEAAVVVVVLRYPELDGRDALGQARIFLPPELRENPSQRLPLIHNAGYELDDASAIGLLARGYVISTPHAHSLNPLGRSVNLDRAILHAACGLPFVQRRHVSVQGGSAGGWMTLMLAADAFPLVWAMPDVPPIHWGFNAAYIGEQQHLSGPPPGSDTPRMPVHQVVGPIADQSRSTYGVPFDHPTYLAVSPLAHLDTLTVPTLMTFSTADMLVPIEQVGRSVVRHHDPGAFPDGFRSDITARFPGVGGKRTLLEVLSPRTSKLFVLPAPSDIPRLRPDGSFEGKAHPIVLPFAPDRTLSIVVLDEGPKEPDVGHFKYAWALDHEPFRKWAEEEGVKPNQLTKAKLERLMKRVVGEPWKPMTIRPEKAAKEIPANQLDYPEAERLDVVVGLRAFAEDDACARRLWQLYRSLPRRLKVFGTALGDGTPASVRAALDQVAAGRRG